MNERLMKYLSKRPEPYEPCTARFWDDEHISKGMLEAHLNPQLESATRKLDFVKKSAKWIRQLADPSKRPKLLDLGCGPGIYTELLAEEGFQVSGVDFSKRSIDYAKEQAKIKKLNIEYMLKNYLTIDYNQAFDAIIMIYCDFGVLNLNDRKLLLKKIYNALKPGGLFIFDVFTMKQFENQTETSNWSYCNGGYWSESPYACFYSFYRYDFCSTYAEQYIILEESNLRCFNLWNHGFSREELADDLAEAGFLEADFYGDAAGRQFDDSSASICSVAKKPSI
ncbi:MAG: methyltransferase domain-containing protein [Bacillota bacterium]